MEFTFNLIDQPWIPCLMLDGEAVECSLYELITEAQHLREIHCETPLVSAAILPMVLALLHRVYGPSSMAEWKTLWDLGAFPREPLETYFEEWYDRFDLFHPQYPFYQAKDDRVKPKSVIHMIHSIGNTSTLFMHVTDQEPVSLSPAMAAQYMLTAQAFHTAGLSGLQEKFTDGIFSRGVLFFAQSDTVFQSLMLNLMPYPNGHIIRTLDNDQPIWEQENPYSRRSVPQGYLDYLTWPSNRLFLLPQSNGGQIVVPQMMMAPGLTLSPDVKAPHKRYERRQRKKQDEWSFLYFNTDKDLWRDYHNLLSLDTEDIKPPATVEWLSTLALFALINDAQSLQLVATGMLADQAKPVFYRAQPMPLPQWILQNATDTRIIAHNISLAEDIAHHLRYALLDLASAVLARGGTQEPDKEDKKALIAQWDVQSSYWQALEMAFWQFIDQLPHDSTNAEDNWRQTLREEARNALEMASRMVGYAPWSLKGQVEAQRRLNSSLKKILDNDQGGTE